MEDKSGIGCTNGYRGRGVAASAAATIANWTLTDGGMERHAHVLYRTLSLGLTGITAGR